MQNGIRYIFVGASGIRSGWRLLIFVLIFAALGALEQIAFKHVPAVKEIVKTTTKEGILSPAFSLIFESANIVILFVAMWVMSKIERRSIWDYGITARGAFGRLFWAGLLVGLIFESAELLLIYLLGGFSFGALALNGAAIVGWGSVWAIAFVLVGISEEGLFRGYALFNLSSRIGFWPAALVLAALFGAVHLSNQGEGWIGAVEVFAFAMFACLTLRRTGSLWFAIGFHAASDYAETFLFSVPDSGMKATHVLLNSSMHGPRWLTGGTVGPEGSLIDFILLAVTAAVFAWRFPAARSQRSET